MRGNVQAVIAGIVAALCFCSVFVHLTMGQIFFPLTTLPLFLILFLQPLRESLLALAASGAVIAALGLSGFFGHGTMIGVLIAFVFAAALPAVIVGKTYALPLKQIDEDAPTRWVPAEVPFIILCVLGAALFYGAMLLADYAFNKPMYTIFFDTIQPFSAEISKQLHAANPELPADFMTAENITTNMTRQMSAFMVAMFVFGQYANLIFAQWILRRRDLVEMPMPYIGNLYFPKQFAFLFVGALVLYVHAITKGWDEPTIFALGPLLVITGLPMLLQGISATHRFLVKTLVKVGVIGVYLGLALGFIAMPVPMCLVFTVTGVANNALVHIKKWLKGK